MKEALGTSMVFNLIMIFVAVFIALFVGSIAYTKGFKVRNRIIDIIQKHEGYNEASKSEIDENLAAIGYRIVDKECGEHKGKTNISTSDYRYCIYELDEPNAGTYYGVKVFIHFDLPLIGDFIEIPLYGETRTIFDKDKVMG